MKRKFSTRIIAGIATSAVLAVGSLSFTAINAIADEAVSYYGLSADGTVISGTVTDYTKIASYDTAWGIAGKETWYVADGIFNIFLCQVGTKKILRIYKPFIGGQPPVNGLRFLYALLPFFVRRFLYAASNASIIGVTGSSLSGLDRYSNRMPFSLNFRSNLMKEEASRLIREVSRARIVPMP